MDTKYFKIICLLSLLFLLTACPGEEVCTTINSDAKADNLIKLIPLQTTYSQGQEIELSLTIPSQNNYYGHPVNILYETQNFSPKLSFIDADLFNQNDITAIEGSKLTFNNQYKLHYFSDTKEYRLKLKIKLNRTGTYNIVSFKDRVVFKGANCSSYFMDTNIEGTDADGNISFEVL